MFHVTEAQQLGKASLFLCCMPLGTQRIPGTGGKNIGQVSQFQAYLCNWLVEDPFLWRALVSIFLEWDSSFRGGSIFDILALVFQDLVAWTERWQQSHASGYFVSKVISHNMVSIQAVASKIKGLSAEIFLQILWSTPFHPACQPRVQMDTCRHAHIHHTNQLT